VTLIGDDVTTSEVECTAVADRTSQEKQFDYS
jgi:hypothetical protein